MEIYLTTENDKFVRLCDGEGASAAFRINGTEAELLSLTVPEEHRRQGVASAMMKTAEKVLAERQVGFISVVYLDTIEGLEGLFLRCGYEICEGCQIIALKTDIIDKSPVIWKMVKDRGQDLNAVSLQKFTIAQWQQLLAFLSGEGLRLTCYDLAHLDQLLSTVVFDRAGKIRSLLLSSIVEKTVYIELLYSGKEAGDLRYLKAAFQNFYDHYLFYEEKTLFKQVVFVSCTPGVNSILEQICGKDHQPSPVGVYKTAGRWIPPLKARNKESVPVMEEDGAQYEWIHIASQNPVQRNIRWKASWYLTRRSK